jgi:hypothetical protein
VSCQVVFHIISIAIIVLLSSSIAFAQDFCKGDFDYDGDVDADDVEEFLIHFGRFEFNNPCPPDGPTPVAKTGQTTSYTTGDDGDLERGVELVSPRFTDNGDGTVVDNQTGLIWMKNANCFEWKPWDDALSDCNGLADGQCGLTDGSSAGDWRLPQIKELHSLIDYSNNNPPLTSGHPFNNVQPYGYWSSTTHIDFPDYAWVVGMLGGNVSVPPKTTDHFVWCVRGGH